MIEKINEKVDRCLTKDGETIEEAKERLIKPGIFLDFVFQNKISGYSGSPALKT